MKYDYIKQGDCLELMKEIPDKSIDVILCDLPYGTTRNKWDSIIPLDLLWEQYERIIKDNGVVVLFSQPPFNLILGNSNLKLFKYEWIWEKTQGTGHLNAKKMPLKIHENILVFYKHLPSYNPIFTYGKPYKCYSGTHSTNYGKQNDRTPTISEDGRRYPTDILKFPSIPNGSKERFHPTQKPIALLEYLIKTYSNEGGVILDNCMGSGSTCVAAINANRHYIGFELDMKYFKIAKERIENTLKEKR